MDPKAGGILRYSYCTPDYVMGSWMLDTRTSYAAINTQNRWQGVIFPTGTGAGSIPSRSAWAIARRTASTWRCSIAT
jgi:hypothetical protein